MKRFAVIAALALTAAACGGGGTSTYTKQASTACFVKKGLKTSPITNSTDFVANSATGGAFRVHLKDNFVTVSFGLTPKDADNIDEAYERFHAAKVGLPDVLRTQGNAVMLWHVHPTDDDISTVTGCLKG